MPFLLVHNIINLEKHDQTYVDLSIARDGSAMIDYYC